MSEMQTLEDLQKKTLKEIYEYARKYKIKYYLAFFAAFLIFIARFLIGWSSSKCLRAFPVLRKYIAPSVAVIPRRAVPSAEICILLRQLPDLKIVQYPYFDYILHVLCFCINIC